MARPVRTEPLVGGMLRSSLRPLLSCMWQTLVEGNLRDKEQERRERIGLGKSPPSAPPGGAGGTPRIASGPGSKVRHVGPSGTPPSGTVPQKGSTASAAKSKASKPQWRNTGVATREKVCCTRSSPLSTLDDFLRRYDALCGPFLSFPPSAHSMLTPCSQASYSQWI